MTRGFITIATGKARYYELAENLLYSYKFFSKNPYPFAILADEENDRTKKFDKVILTDKSTYSFMDKFLLFENLPYDETIFIDADSLAYGDLNKLWNIFDGSTDFSSFGQVFNLEEEGDIWYEINGIGKYGEGVTYRCRMHAGVCFFRKSEKLLKTYRDSLAILKDYDNLHFTKYADSRDECALAVAMAKNDMIPIPEPIDFFVTYPCCTWSDVKIINCNELAVSYGAWGSISKCGLLVHFGTPSTKTPLYRFSLSCITYIKRYQNKKAPLLKKILYEKRLKYFFMKFLFKISFFFKRVGIKLGLKKK